MAEKLYKIISKVMNINIEEINDESSPTSISNWTSFNGYVLLDELETNFDVKFSIDEAMDVKNVSDIKRHLQNHGVNFND
ncbi:MAG: acyl carrier protein [Thaumarchaeota archaeon]|nr:MAG: acyl carrier protein [Nitrososphaerota archaeon]